MSSHRQVAYQLCSIHCWTSEELRAMDGAIRNIEDQTESAIVYLNDKKRFKITGADSQKQQSALSALSDMLNHKMPAVINLSDVPYDRLGMSENNSMTSTPNSNHLQGTIITTEDLSAALRAATLEDAAPATPPQDEEFMRIFRVNDEVEDEEKMYYQEKSQKHDLPTIIAESYGCTAEVSGPGEPRNVTIIGKDKANVDICLRQMEEMQVYYLRKPFMKQKVALFYGNPTEIYRVRFQLLSEHPFHSTRTTIFPTSANMKEPKNYCIAVKATYDQMQGVWAISNRRSPPPSRATVETPSPARGQSRSQSPTAQNYGGQWQNVSSFEAKPSMWSTARPGASPASSSPRSSPQPWGRPGPASAARRPTTPRAASDWSSVPDEGLDASSSSSDWPAPSSETPSWANTVTEGLASNPFGTPNRAPSVVRTMRQSEWPAPAFDTRGDGDFPSLATAKPRAQKSGMPKLPPVRIVTPDPAVGNLLDLGSSSQAPSPAPPQATHGMVTAVSNRPLVFGEEDFAFLESKTAKSRSTGANTPNAASGSSRSASVNTLNAAAPRLRDPVKEEEDKRREVRRMTLQQASPGEGNAVKEFIDGERAFNLRRQSESIRACLDELRGQRKEIRLVGRLGLSLFPKDSSLANKVFECSELHRSRPDFSPITTTSLENIESLFGYLGHPTVDTAQYEVFCNSRNNPILRWTETMITIPSNKAVLDRVVHPWETFGEVTWNGLDRDLDFELLLQAREGISRNLTTALGRTDVKPYKEFQKKLSLGTKNSHITCRDIADYLEVLQIVFRESKHFDRKDGSGCIIVVHRVEELQLTRERELGLVKGMTRGRGKTWYEVEVHCEMINKRLKSNLTITPGLVADWEAGDLLGDVILNPTDRPLVRMVQNLMELANECQQKFAY